MHKTTAMKYFCVVISILIALSTFTTAAPPYADYDNNIRDLLEILMQREGAEDRFGGLHQMVRKASRSPSLRLRFGKRPDSSIVPVSAYMAGITDEN